MALGSILGFIAAVALFLGSIALETNNYFIFISASSAMMVIGGTFSAAYMSFRGRYVTLAQYKLACRTRGAFWQHELVCIDNRER